MAADTALLSTFPLTKSHPAAGILRNTKHINSRRPLTTGTSRHNSENISTSIVRLNKHNNSIPLPVASYYYTTSTFPSLYATFSTDKLRKNSVTSNTSHTKKHVQFRVSTKPNSEKTDGPTKISSLTKPSTEFKPSHEEAVKIPLRSSELDKVSSENTTTNVSGNLASGLPVKGQNTNQFLKNENLPAFKETNLSKNTISVKSSECKNQNNHGLKTTPKIRLFEEKNISQAPASVQRNRSTSLTNLYRVRSDEVTSRSRKISSSTTLSLSPINKKNHKKVNSFLIENNTTPEKPALKKELRRHSSAIYPRSLSQSFLISSQKSFKHTTKNTVDGKVTSNNKTTFEKYYSAQLKLSDDIAKRFHNGSKLSYSNGRRSSQSSINKAINRSINSHEVELTKSKNTSSSSTSQEAHKQNSLESSQQTDQTPSTLNATITTSTVPTVSNLAYINSSWDHADNAKSPSLDHLLHRPKSVGSLTTKFLTPEQLIIRESVEKVQRWIRTLPKHFDAIQNVLPPVQQDY